jgi:RNA polymerase sigma-70 factor, ECF subfamily
MPEHDGDELFATYRSLLFSIAYRMLGSAMDAEDMVQEAYLRWNGTDPGTVQQPRAFLTAIITRLCIDHLRSAQVQRESYIGPWLPEPLLTAPGGGPAENVAERESLSLAFLVMLERLSPVERAAFLLREVFAHGYDELARILETSEANARQLVSRARRKLDGLRPDRLKFAAAPDHQASLARQFVQAIGSGDVGRVLNLLAPEVVMVADGGGKAFASKRPIIGADEVARFFVNLKRVAPPNTSGAFIWVNGALALAVYEGDVATILLVPVVEGDRITTVYAMRNPDKLAAVPRLAEVAGAFPLS